MTGKLTDVMLPGGDYLWGPLFLDYLKAGWLTRDLEFAVGFPFRKQMVRFKQAKARQGIPATIDSTFAYVEWQRTQKELKREVHLPVSATIERLKSSRTCGFSDMMTEIQEMKRRAVTLSDLTTDDDIKERLSGAVNRLETAARMLIAHGEFGRAPEVNGNANRQLPGENDPTSPDLVADVLFADSELRQAEVDIIRRQITSRLR